MTPVHFLQAMFIVPLDLQAIISVFVLNQFCRSTSSNLLASHHQRFIILVVSPNYILIKTNQCYIYIYTHV